MLEAILILNIIILVVVFLMMPTVAGTSQYLNSRKADSRKIQKMFYYVYALKRIGLVQVHEEALAKELKEFSERTQSEEEEYKDGGYPYSWADDNDAHVYARRVNTTKEEYEEQRTFLIEMAREDLYKLDCEEHNYRVFSDGYKEYFDDGEKNRGYDRDWRRQRADWASHESFDNE
jgi:hypothetical protein